MIITGKKLIFLIAVIILVIFNNIIMAAGEADYSQLFSKEQIINVKVEIDKEQLNDIYENPMVEEYHPATVSYNGYQLEAIGIRTKGNSSLMSVAKSDSERYSFKLKFDEYIEGQNLLGLTTINLNNNFSDPSYLREYLTYQLMEKMGVPTPVYSFVNFYINGELKGLYLAVQQIDESFIESNFKAADGDLYKPDGEGSDLLWQGDDISNYSGIGYKSEKNTDHRALLDMLDELNNGTNYEKYLNVDEILRYFAVSTVLVNMDSYQGTMKHNYYLYEEDGVFSIIPWDFNMSFAGFSMGGSQEQIIALKIDEPTLGSLSERPLIAKLLQVPEYKEKYHQYIKEIITNYLEPASFEKEVLELAAFLRPYIKEDPTKFYTLEEFESSFKENTVSEDENTGQVLSVERGSKEENTGQDFADNNKQNFPAMNMKAQIGIITFVKERVANVKQQLAGEISSSGDGSGIGAGGGIRRPFAARNDGVSARNGEDEQNIFPDIPGANSGQFPENPDVMEETFESGKQPVNMQNNMRENFNAEGIPGNNNGQRMGRGLSPDNRNNTAINYLSFIGMVIMLLIIVVLSILFLRNKI